LPCHEAAATGMLKLNGLAEAARGKGG